VKFIRLLIAPSVTLHSGISFISSSTLGVKTPNLNQGLYGFGLSPNSTWHLTSHRDTLSSHAFWHSRDVTCRASVQHGATRTSRHVFIMCTQQRITVLLSPKNSIDAVQSEDNITYLNQMGSLRRIMTIIGNEQNLACWDTSPTRTTLRQCRACDETSGIWALDAHKTDIKVLSNFQTATGGELFDKHECKKQTIRNYGHFYLFLHCQTHHYANFTVTTHVKRTYKTCNPADISTEPHHFCVLNNCAIFCSNICSHFHTTFSKFLK